MDARHGQKHWTTPYNAREDHGSLDREIGVRSGENKNLSDNCVNDT